MTLTTFCAIGVSYLKWMTYLSTPVVDTALPLIIAVWLEGLCWRPLPPNRWGRFIIAGLAVTARLERGPTGPWRGTAESRNVHKHKLMNSFSDTDWDIWSTVQLPAPLSSSRPRWTLCKGRRQTLWLFTINRRHFRYIREFKLSIAKRTVTIFGPKFGQTNQNLISRDF
jgi:hypothetical protein